MTIARDLVRRLNGLRVSRLLSPLLERAPAARQGSVSPHPLLEWRLPDAIDRRDGQPQARGAPRRHPLRGDRKRGRKRGRSFKNNFWTCTP
jgi:hypothetical protein